jgi:hypothetical protein
MIRSVKSMFHELREKMTRVHKLEHGPVLPVSYPDGSGMFSG